MEFILVVVGVVLILSMTTLYMYLVGEDKIEPHTPPRVQRGNGKAMFSAAQSICMNQSGAPVPPFIYHKHQHQHQHT